MGGAGVIKKLAGVTAASVAIGALVALWARYIEPRRLSVTRLDYGGNRDGALTIAFVTDMHIGPHTNAAAMEPVIRALEAEQPDVLLFGGDFICESPRFVHELEEPLTRMADTASIGSWGVWGNHDLANTRERIKPVLERAGVTMLVNESVEVADDVWVVGIDDVLLGKPDIEAAFAGLPINARSICMWHEPDVADRVAPYAPTLILSGHTHGGQIRLPFIGELATPSLGKRYVAGEYNVSGVPLYVSRGNGMYRPPVRLNCSPELVLIRF